MKKEVYKPTYYYKNIFTINYKRLKKQGIKYLLLDIDNTIKDDKGKNPDNKDIELINKLKNDFTIILLSNSYPARVHRFADAFNIDSFYFSLKPLSLTYKKILKKYSLKPDIIAAIGDQLFTDIKGANKMHITSILVDKISNNETIVTKINRIREKKYINRYKLIERGKYDE
jgi:HAD superfamily phosphatase (TIGR01668 family)